MCVIIYKPEGATLERSLLERSIEGGNIDGLGVMTARNGHVNVTRTMNVKDCLAPDYIGDAECFIHFRYGTHGTRDISNCHPFKITKGLYLMHNGIAPIPQFDQNRSDTWHVAQLLKPMFERDRGLLGSKYLEEILQLVGGSGSKWAFLRADGASRIVGRNKGVEHKGLWLSNSTPLEDPYAKWDDWAKWHYEPKSSVHRSVCVNPARQISQTATAVEEDRIIIDGYSDEMEWDGYNDEERIAAHQGIRQAEPPLNLSRLAEMDYEDILEVVCNYPDDVAELIWKSNCLGG
jgi:hypothetical protein